MLSFLEKSNQYLIASSIFVFNLIGLFGNVHFVLLTRKNVNLQSKSYQTLCCTRRTFSAALTSILCVAHSICLIFELHNALLLWTNSVLHRDKCFFRIFLYVFLICFQTALMLTIVFDIYFIVFFTSTYRLLNSKKYILLILSFPTTFGAFTTYRAYQNIDSERISFCNPNLVLVPNVRTVWIISNVTINTLILFLFTLLLFHFYKKGKSQNKDTRKIIGRLKVTVIVFVFTWYTSSIAGELIDRLQIDQKYAEILHGNLVLPILFSYSQTFYMFLWRSSEYRLAFLDVWSCLPFISICRKSKAQPRVQPFFYSSTSHIPK